jgi:hypothetical protein
MRRGNGIGLLLITFWALGAGSCKEVFTPSLDQVNVKLLAPGNHVISDSTTQDFYWQPVDTGVRYELVVVTPRFDSIVSLLADTTISTNQVILTLAPAQYQWQVRAFNPVSSTQYSTPWTITIN